MKFEYTEQPERGGAIAYITFDGDLVLKDRDGDKLFIFSETGVGRVTSTTFRVDDNAQRVFFKGDSLTITF